MKNTIQGEQTNNRIRVYRKKERSQRGESAKCIEGQVGEQFERADNVPTWVVFWILSFISRFDFTNDANASIALTRDCDVLVYICVVTS